MTGASQRTEQQCGCAEWLELADGQWVTRYWSCSVHEVMVEQVFVNTMPH